MVWGVPPPPLSALRHSTVLPVDYRKMFPTCRLATLVLVFEVPESETRASVIIFISRELYPGMRYSSFMDFLETLLGVLRILVLVLPWLHMLSWQRPTWLPRATFLVRLVPLPLLAS